MGLYHSITIGTIRIPGNLFLAPMAGYTDAAFRTLATREGADLTYTELVSAEGIIRKSKQTKLLLTRGETEQYWGIQLFTSSPYGAAQAVKQLHCLSPTLFDLNCGCPVPKVVKTGGGAALLKDPSLIYAIVRALRDSTEIPITVKIRSGWDNTSLNYLETADAAIQGGASMVCLHPRTRMQGYSGVSNWNHILTLKTKASVPILGSGDLFTPQDVHRMLLETSCDGVMIARGAVGNPFIFRKARALLEGSPIPEISLQEKIEAALEHLDLSIRFLGEAVACREMRKHICAYVKGIPGSSNFRNAIVHAENRIQFVTILEEFANSLRFSQKD
ncbi:MAG TPA: tRNA dihydrouridine synthase DusB [Spirochaetales bacterium]|nr:tRNA dihydrouridine synthase DusB [Spirochaetales bacterium]